MAIHLIDHNDDGIPLDSFLTQAEILARTLNLDPIQDYIEMMVVHYGDKGAFAFMLQGRAYDCESLNIVRPEVDDHEDVYPRR